jgi:hypothetical protein
MYQNGKGNMEISNLHNHISDYIQGVFSEQDMGVLKKEIEKLKPGEIYVEIGVDEGRSARVAHEYADPRVFKVWIDVHDVVPHSKSIGRAPWMEQEKMVGLNRNGFYVHGDADFFAGLIIPNISLMFIDGSHDYDSIKRNTQIWEPLMVKGGVLLFHDYDHPDVKKWLDEWYGDNKEVFHNKMAKVRL